MEYLFYMLPAYLFVLAAQIYVKIAFSKYSAKPNERGITGAQAARLIAPNVNVNVINGNLTDHYDPSTDTISLSSQVLNESSIAAVGVAAHEAGHALQYAEEYAPIKLRMAIVPVCNIGSRLAVPLIILGLITSIKALAFFGIISFALVVFFQLVTLPVEFNASRRAVQSLSETGLLTQQELKGVKSVLFAAAMTYVGALAVSALQLVYYVGRVRRR